MSYATSSYAGDDIYTANCTGDAVVGDEVRFERATFVGSFRRPKFAGFETITATIIADSYGADKQQHTFTLELADGGTLRIKGRTLYANGVWRKPRAAEGEDRRREQLDEKHARGDRARAQRQERITNEQPWRLA